MKKADKYKKINRNTMFNNSNRVTPEHILTSDPIWMPDEEMSRPSGVRIVELRSSASDQSVRDENEIRRTSNSKDDDYKINKAARERRRKYIENQEIPGEFHDEMTQFDEDYVYANYLYSGTSGMDHDNVIYNEVNCFTIYDKHLMNSDNSDEGRGDIELIQCGPPSPNWSCDQAPDWNRAPACDTEFIRFDPDVENEKRTVWIYSFKNKRLLSENDYELVNIPSTSSSIEIEDLDDSKAICPNSARIPTPLPPSNIPKLKIPALPTVTEVTEPKVSLSSQIGLNKNKEKFRIKENNNWLSAQVTPKRGGDTTDHSTSVLNWMALSPRDKKRRFRHVSPLTVSYDINILPTVKEATSTSEKNNELPKPEVPRDCGDSIKEFDETGKGIENVKQGHDQATNTDITFTLRKSVLDQMCTAVADSARKSAKSLRSNVSSVIGSLTTVRERTDAKSPREIYDNTKQNIDCKETATFSKKRVSVREKASLLINATTNTGRGDFSKRKVPRISIPTSPAVKISTENLKSNDWIQEEKLIDDGRIMTPTDGEGDRASNAIWMRNMALLKPAEWTAYLPIAESIPSLQLSMNTDSIDGTQNWFRRMVRLFKCCK